MLTDRYKIELGATMESEFQDWCLKLLGHPSNTGFEYTEFVGKSSTKPALAAWRHCTARAANMWGIV
jgi:hypothetical protein